MEDTSVKSECLVVGEEVIMNVDGAADDVVMPVDQEEGEGNAELQE